MKVIWDFITDPDIGPYARVKRKPIPINPSVSEEVADDMLKNADDVYQNGKVENGHVGNGVHENTKAQKQE